MTQTSSHVLVPTDCPRESTRPVQRSNVVKDVAIVLYDGFSLPSADTLAEALHVANELQSKSSSNSLTYRVNLISARGGAVTCSSSMSVWTERLAARHFDRLDILFIPGGSGVARASADDNLIDLLRLACARSVSVTAIGNGHMVLSAAGVARRDWPSMQQDIHLKSSSASAPEHDRDQALMTSLALLKTDLGAELAVRVADRLGSGGHHSLAFTIGEMDATTLDEKARASARWLVQNCAKPISVGDAARTSSMSERNFLRLFKREIGVTPSKYLLRARLDLTCKMLANSDLPVDKIARRTGLSNGERLSKLFRKELSMSPTEFRARSQRKS
ncbi:Transcriptional regulator GlxA family, contains an amidase domain and an AraC-type DNA-binding HTH domain [Burkholderia sp. GAS332]|jgi:transcriptional regulator GlxA family with amidase domain|uniref:GlxA family transcriptional regulator n=1 Tax=Paraburkholderia sediminicola TaxID=458836 RepID=UPI000929A44C|nr:Transcriptional regulator GlxA family, contains an amidase domain and an AraC-type DNA-binding HTH domain [Burkholderia sp. GAS332]